MAIDFSKIYLTAQPLSPASQSLTGTAGAVVEFLGVVRSLEGEEQIAGLDYEAFNEMAELKLREIVVEIATKHLLEDFTLIHRIGFVPVGEPSLLIRITSKHRSAALKSCGEVIDRLKKEVPIWKKVIPLSLL